MSGSRARVARAIATWFGVGYVPRAPGTAGSVAGLALYLAVRGIGPVGVLALAGVVAGVGVWAASSVVAERGEVDPQIVVVDEVAGVLIALAFSSPSVASMASAFVAFRVCDQLKPWPSSAAERLPSGWGVVADDVVAGLQAALLAHELGARS